MSKEEKQVVKKTKADKAPKSDKSPKSDKAPSVPKEEKTPKAEVPASKAKQSVVVSVGQKVKRVSKDLSGTVVEVKSNDKGFTTKVEVLWENGQQYVLSVNNIKTI